MIQQIVVIRDAIKALSEDPSCPEDVALLLDSARIELGQAIQLYKDGQ